jgi:hypothetical protein
MGVDPTERLPESLHAINRVIADLDSGKTLDMTIVRNMLAACHDALLQLGNHCNYLDDSLTAAVTGELPERFDLNQMLLAQRTKAYIKWLEETKDPRDKLHKGPPLLPAPGA